MRLSIILPVYNVEKYILSCVESLYAQDLPEKDFEVIIIDDGTPDNSIEVLEDWKSCHSNMQVITQQNSGVSVARNTGLEAAKGEYVLFVDPDDVIVPGTLEKMLFQIKESGADILVGGYMKKNNSEIEGWREKIHLPELTRTEFCGKGSDYLVRYYDQAAGYAVVNLYRRAFLTGKGIHFKEGITFTEDTLFTITAFLSAEKVETCQFVFYLYRQHDASALSTMSLSKLQSLNIVLQEIEKLRKQTVFSRAVEQKLEDCSFSLFSVLLWYLSHYGSLVKHRKIILKDLRNKVPCLFFRGNAKQRFISVCYNWFPSGYIYLRYLFASGKY